jgi:hypothetical protein
LDLVKELELELELQLELGLELELELKLDLEVELELKLELELELQLELRCPTRPLLILLRWFSLALFNCYYFRFPGNLTAFRGIRFLFFDIIVGALGHNEMCNEARITCCSL